MLRVEPEIIANYVARGDVQLAFWHILDYAPSATAHQAVECAGAQDPRKFWVLHHVLFERQGELWGDTATAVTTMAAEIGLDPTSFSSCMADGDVAAKVSRMDQERRAANIRLRPTFSINGTLYPGAQPYENLVQIFDRLLAP